MIEIKYIYFSFIKNIILILWFIISYILKLNKKYICHVYYTILNDSLNSYILVIIIIILIHLFIFDIFKWNIIIIYIKIIMNIIIHII